MIPPCLPLPELQTNVIMNIIVFLAQKGVQRVSTKKQPSQVVALSPCPVSKINTVPLTQLLQDYKIYKIV